MVSYEFWVFAMMKKRSVSSCRAGWGGMLTMPGHLVYSRDALSLRNTAACVIRNRLRTLNLPVGAPWGNHGSGAAILYRKSPGMM